MPFLRYECRECGEVFEELVKLVDSQAASCPKCGSAAGRQYAGKCSFGQVKSEPVCPSGQVGCAASGCPFAHAN